jgi:hypothetical protein
MSVTYSYFCSTEGIKVLESRNESDPVPTQCKNGIGHIIGLVQSLPFEKRRRVFRYPRNPLPTDDAFSLPQSFFFGDIWINTLTQREFVCVNSDDPGHAKWVLSSMRYPDIYSSFTTNITAYVERNGDLSYRLVASLLFPGSSATYEGNPSEVVLLTSASGADPIQWRVFDRGTSMTICESTPQTHFRDFLPVSMIPNPMAIGSNPSTWEIQVKDIVTPPALSHNTTARLSACVVRFA